MGEPLLTPLTKTRLHEDILEQLKTRIVRGDLAPGERLPPERELAEQLRVNRTTVREALHKLEGLGLVEIKHGNGIFVRDWLESGSLELARTLLLLDGGPNLGVLRDLLVLRRLVVPSVSFYAAQHRTDAHLADLRRVLDDPTLAPEQRDWRVHNLLARASGNVLFVIFLNAFTAMADDSSRAYFANAEHRARSARFYEEMFAALERRDADRARVLMADVLAYAEGVLLDVTGGG